MYAVPKTYGLAGRCKDWNFSLTDSFTLEPAFMSACLSSSMSYVSGQ